MDAARQPLAHNSAKLRLDQLKQAREWAAQETEGNVSQMVRKLLDEAIATRKATSDRAADPDVAVYAR